MGHRAPRPLAVAIEAARRQAAPRTPLAAVQQVWREVAGEQIAAVSEPVSEREGVVVVRCDGSVWAQELDLMQDRLLAALRDRLGDGAPDRLRFDSR